MHQAHSEASKGAAVNLIYALYNPSMACVQPPTFRIHCAMNKAPRTLCILNCVHDEA